MDGDVDSPAVPRHVTCAQVASLRTRLSDKQASGDTAAALWYFYDGR